MVDIVALSKLLAEATPDELAAANAMIPAITAVKNIADKNASNDNILRGKIVSIGNMLKAGNVADAAVLMDEVVGAEKDVKPIADAIADPIEVATK